MHLVLQCDVSSFVGIVYSKSLVLMVPIEELEALFDAWRVAPFRGCCLILWRIIPFVVLWSLWK